MDSWSFVSTCRHVLVRCVFPFVFLSGLPQIGHCTVICQGNRVGPATFSLSQPSSYYYQWNENIRVVRSVLAHAKVSSVFLIVEVAQQTFVSVLGAADHHVAVDPLLFLVTRSGQRLRAVDADSIWVEG